MKKTTAFLTFVAVVAATVAAGTLHGHMTLRWGSQPDMEAAADLLERIPDRCGDWRMESSGEMPESTVKMLRCAGYISRRYVNQRNGDAVDMSIVFGVPGPIAEHTPEVCLSSREFTPLGHRERANIDRAGGADASIPGDELWFADFKNNRILSERRRVYWAWSAGGRWSAPNGPKTTFAGSPHLYKIQLSTSVRSGPIAAMPEAPDDACGRFLSEFLPVAERYLAEDVAGRIQQTTTRQ